MREMVAPMMMVIGLSIPLWVAFSGTRLPVQPYRVIDFSRRHGVVITVANGNHVIAYLATTRRWRAFGLAGGIVVSVLSGLPDITFQLLPLLAGWFVGALAAELRVPPPPAGVKRSAFAAPRTLSVYLRPEGRKLLPALALVAVLIGLIRPMQTLVWTIAAVGLWLAARFIQRKVLERPQPVGPPDVIAADDAIRSRSQHVLAGAGMTLMLLLIITQLSLLLVFPLGLLWIASAIVALLGWQLARSRWLVVRAA